MRVEVRYFAEDDTEFFSEAECKEYEDRINKSLSSVIFFDENMKKLDPPTLTFIESNALYMKIVDAQGAAVLFPWLYEQISIVTPEEHTYDDGDILAWHDNDGEWVNMKAEAAKLLHDIGVIEKEARS